MKAKLLASSPYPDFEAIKSMIARYWCCKPEDIKLVEIKIGMVRLNASHVYKRDTQMIGFEVKRKGNRLRFEYIGGAE